MALTLVCAGTVSVLPDGSPTCSAGWTTQLAQVPFDASLIDPTVATAVFGAGFALAITPWAAAWGFSKLLKLLRQLLWTQLPYQLSPALSISPRLPRELAQLPPRSWLFYWRSKVLNFYSALSVARNKWGASAPRFYSILEFRRAGFIVLVIFCCGFATAVICLRLF